MKKNLIPAFLVLVALTPALAGGPSRLISLFRINNNVVISRPEVPGLPGTNPLSQTEDDNFFSLEATQTDDALFLTASSAAFAQVTIEDESSAVVYDQLELLGSEPTEIATDSWASGSYTLYINIGEDRYEGVFEL